VVVGDYLTSTGTTHAFVWRDLNGDHVVQSAEFQDLHDLLTTDSLGDSIATAVIDPTPAVPHLQVVANTTVKGGGWQSAFLLTDLNDDGDFLDAREKTALASSGETQAFAINDVGEVAGFTGGNAVIWQNGVVTNNLGQFKRGTPIPTGINHAGQVVGWAIGADKLNSLAWVWTGSAKIQDLNNLIPNKPGWTELESAWGINDTGTIVGQGQITPGVWHGFLLTPKISDSAVETASPDNRADANASSLDPLGPLVGDDLVRSLADGIHPKKIKDARHP
jgi:hypothetical protein